MGRVGEEVERSGKGGGMYLRGVKGEGRGTL